MRSLACRLAAVVLFVALAVRCSPSTPLWTRANTSLEQLNADRNQCLGAARRYLPTGEQWTDYDAIDTCMAFKGYTREKR